MTHLLDTDRIISHLRGKSEIIPAPNQTLAMSIITLGELLYGAERSHDPSKTREAISLLQSDFQISVLEVTEAIIIRFANIKAELSKRGALIEDFDILIAATALEQSLTLVTGNKKHFSRVPGLSLA